MAELEHKLAAENKDGACRLFTCPSLSLNWVTDPAWVVQHALKAHARDLEQKEDERRERLAKARERERQLRSNRQRRDDSERPSKRIRLDEEADLDDFLPVDREEKGPESGLNLSDKVLALMRRWVCSSEL